MNGQVELDGSVCQRKGTRRAAQWRVGVNGVTTRTLGGRVTTPATRGTLGYFGTAGRRARRRGGRCTRATRVRQDHAGTLGQASEDVER